MHWRLRTPAPVGLGDRAEEQGCEDCRVVGSGKEGWGWGWEWEQLGSRSKQCVAQGQPQNLPTRPPMWTSVPVLALGPFNLVCPGEATQSGQRKRTPEQQSGVWLRPVSLLEPTLPLPRGSGPESARSPCPLPPDSLCMVQDLASARFLVACFCFAMMCGFCDPRSSVKQGGS